MCFLFTHHRECEIGYQPQWRDHTLVHGRFLSVLATHKLLTILCSDARPYVPEIAGSFSDIDHVSWWSICLCFRYSFNARWCSNNVIVGHRVRPVGKEKVSGRNDLPKRHVLSSEWKTERVREDASGDREDGEEADDELPCMIGESETSWNIWVKLKQHVNINFTNVSVKLISWLLLESYTKLKQLMRLISY